MSLIGFRPVRCLTCDKRFYMRYSLVKDYDQELSNRTYARSESNAGGKSGRLA